MGFGSIYSVSWFGDTNAANGWGIVYPSNADGSLLTAVLELIGVRMPKYRDKKRNTFPSTTA